MWNERDPILKERLFGLTNSEANHGEDVKEYYFYLDSTPTHSYMKYLYKYPQREYPYRSDRDQPEAIAEEFEYELLDTGIFNDDRYFDVFVEYAKEGPEDILIRMTVHNRGPEAARLRLCRRCGSATPGRGARMSASRRCAKWARRRRPHTLSWVTTGCIAMALRSCSSPRMRAMRSVCGASPTRRPMSRTRSTSTSSRDAAKR